MPEGFQPTAGGGQMPEWMKLDLEVGLISFHFSAAPLSPPTPLSRLHLGSLLTYTNAASFIRLERDSKRRAGGCESDLL